jgi:hypothetical protein
MLIAWRNEGPECRSVELIRGRALRTAVAAVMTLALSVAAVACGSSDDAPEARDAAGSGRPSPSPSPIPLWDRTPGSIAALGDSITIGFDTCALLADCPEASWVTGTDAAVNSVSDQLSEPVQDVVSGAGFSHRGGEA